MPTYDEWNDALIGYLTHGVPRGAEVFLDINDDILEDIGWRVFKMKDVSVTRWPDDFKRAVRAKCIRGTRVSLYSVFGYTTNGRPKGVAFLGAMVLAAYYMGEDDAVTSANYFKRLREVLGLDKGEGRPDGMEQGNEEVIWLQWGLWLQKQGILSTVQAGKGSKIYINYPISQSLLRRTDKERLFKLFEEKKLPQYLDQNTVSARIRREILYLSKHIQSLLAEGSIQRYQALNEAIFEAYEEWGTSGRGATKNRESMEHFKTRNLFAELCRITELGIPTYYLYPRQPRKFRLPQLQVRRNGVLENLVEEHPGWFEPLWERAVDGEELESGAQYTLLGDADFQNLILPARDFWILTRDPDNPESGTYVSGNAPDLGIPFILLCKKYLQEQIAHLQNERLVKWHGDPSPLLINPEWVEYRGMMVLSEAWTGVFIKNRDLYESLRPYSSLNIGLEGGMRIPNLGAWLVGYGPQITIFTFADTAHLSIRKIGSEQTLFEQEVHKSEPIQIQWPDPGDYIIEASSEALQRERLVKLLPWDQLPLAAVQMSQGMNLGPWQIYGALVKSSEELK